MSTSNFKSRKLGFESLEGRRVCAGQVTAAIVNRELVVTGGAAANYVSVQQQMVGNPAELFYVVRGLPFTGAFTASGDPIQAPLSQATRTVVNNAPPSAADVVRFPAAAIDTVKVSLGGGNDAVRVGGDNGAVAFFNTTRLQVETGLDNDYLKVGFVNINGTPDDFSFFHTTQNTPSEAAGLRELGNDKLVVDTLRVNDTDLFMGTGGGDDKISITGLFTTGVDTEIFLYAGDGADNLSWSSSNLGAQGFSSKQTSIFMGAGIDTANISGVRFTLLLADLGTDNDTLTLAAMVANKTTVRGGAGANDRLVKVGANNNLGAAPGFSGLESNDFI